MDMLKDKRVWLGLVLALLAVAGVMYLAPKAKAADKGKPPVARTEANVFDDAPVKPQSWSGVYIGGAYGYGATNGELNYSAAPAANLDGLSATGQVGGVDAGADLQIPGSFVVIGARAGYVWSNEEFTARVGTTSFTAGLDKGWHVDGRLGAGFGTAMPYVFVGYTKMETSASFAGTALTAPDLKGWRYGAGVEFRLPKIDVSMFTPTLAIETVYTDYESVALSKNLTLNVTDLAAMGRLNLKFNPR